VLDSLTTIGLAAALFVVTDVDDLVLLTSLFAIAPHRRRQIIVGQYLGIAVLVMVSIAVAVGLFALPTSWIRWIGLIPLLLGIKGLLDLTHSRDDSDQATARGRRPVGVFSTALLTVGSGGDNVAAYVPVLHRISPSRWPLLIAVFAVGVLLWCLLAAWLGGHRHVQAILDRAGHWIVPMVYIAIGAWLLL
jgi:cadmium resistance protein CadD (predicted permease)